MTTAYERRYISRLAGVAHLLSPFELSKDDNTPTALCGRWQWTASDWFGSGSQAEYERAAELPLCKSCARQIP